MKVCPELLIPYLRMNEWIPLQGVCKQWEEVLAGAARRLGALHETFHLTRNQDAKVAHQKIRPMFREILVEWIYDLQHDFRFEISVFFRGVRYLDLFFCKTTSVYGAEHYQLIAAGCFWLAAKFEDNDNGYISKQLVYQSSGVFEMKHLLAIERIIWKTLYAQLFVSTIWSTLVVLLDAFPVTEEIRCFCERIACQIQWNQSTPLYACVGLAAAVYHDAALLFEFDDSDAMDFAQYDIAANVEIQYLVARTRIKGPTEYMKHLCVCYDLVSNVKTKPNTLH